MTKVAKSKEIYASPTDASRPKEPASHQHTFWHSASIGITFCPQQSLLYHLTCRLNAAFIAYCSCVSAGCHKTYDAIWEGDVWSTTIAQENGDHVTPSEARGDWSDSTLRKSSAKVHTGVLSEVVGFLVRKHRFRCSLHKSRRTSSREGCIINRAKIRSVGISIFEDALWTEHRLYI